MPISSSDGPGAADLSCTINCSGHATLSSPSNSVDQAQISVMVRHLQNKNPPTSSAQKTTGPGESVPQSSQNPMATTSVPRAMLIGIILWVEGSMRAAVCRLARSFVNAENGIVDRA